MRKPATVKNAVYLLYFTLLISLIGGLTALFGGEVISRTPNIGAGAYFGIFIVSLIVLWLIYFFIGLGWNWARILYLILYIIGAISWLTSLAALQQGLITFVFTTINLFLGLIALVMLFTPAANPWFRRRK